jgi:ArsR family transcriptional regulator
VLDQATLLGMLRAAAETTRLRVLALLAHGELSVKDLTRILGQSQPRVSRHMKLLVEAGMVERARDGSWAYFQLVDSGGRGAFCQSLLASIDPADPVLARDRQRAATVKREREAEAQDYFRRHAADWDRIRALHVQETEVEAAVLEALGPGPFRLLVDLGTGTGRMLELLAERYDRAVGFDINHTMLAYARSKIETAGIASASVRHGDLYDVALDSGVADAVVMHQVLHFLTDPGLAIGEAARLLAPGGRLVIIDFAQHDLEFLRTEFAHERLGFADAQMAQWLAEAGLEAEPARRLATQGASGKGRLTVTVWTGRSTTGRNEDAGEAAAYRKVEA